MLSIRFFFPKEKARKKKRGNLTMLPCAHAGTHPRLSSSAARLTLLEVAWKFYKGLSLSLAWHWHERIGSSPSRYSFEFKRDHQRSVWLTLNSFYFPKRMSVLPQAMARAKCARALACAHEAYLALDFFCYFFWSSKKSKKLNHQSEADSDNVKEITRLILLWKR